jgi:glycerophosphoryl diester phosphodiesterase
MLFLTIRMKVLRLTLLGLFLIAAGYNVFLWTITFDKTNLDNLNNGEVQIIGHGGMGFASFLPFKYYPTNSYGSLFKAIDEFKVEGVEVDLHLTKDRKFVLFHDGKLDNKTALPGCTGDKTLGELTQTNYQLGVPFDWFQSERIIGLAELLDSLLQRKEFPFLHLDVRNWNECNTPQENDVLEGTIALELIKLLNDKQVPTEKILIISLSPNFLMKLKEINNPYPVSFEIVGREFEFLQWAIDNGIKSVTVKPKLLTKEISKMAHNSGLQVITFGAKSKSGNKKLLELNPDVIQTDNIPALKELMGYE